MVNLYVEKLSEILKTNTEPLEDKEYQLFTELSNTQKLKMELIEAIRHTSDRQLADNEEIVTHLHNRSSGLIQPLYKYLQQIAIAQLENTLEPSSEEGIDIDEVIGITRTARVTM